MKDMKIIFSDDSRDFAPWMSEKCGNVLLSLCRILQQIPDITKNECFCYALDEALKVYALCCEDLDGIYSKLVYSLLVKFNVEGYNYLNDLIFGTKNSSIMQEVMQAERNEEILILIEQNDKTNRTEIARILGCSTNSNQWIQEIRDDIEFVHQGVQSWE